MHGMMIKPVFNKAGNRFISQRATKQNLKKNIKFINLHLKDFIRY